MSMIDSLTKPRTLGVLLALAIGLNLFLAGILAGRFGADQLRPPPFARGFEHSMRFIPEHQRTEMRRHMHAMMPKIKQQTRAIKQLHEQLAAELMKPTPDRATLEKQLQDIGAQAQSMQQALHEAFLDSALKLPPQERRAMLDGMLSARGDGFMPRHNSPKPPGPAFNEPLPPPDAGPGFENGAEPGPDSTSH